MAAGGTTVGASSFNQLSSAEPFSRPFAAVICIRLMVMGEVTGRTEERPDLEASYYDNASTSVSSNRSAMSHGGGAGEPGRAQNGSSSSEISGAPAARAVGLPFSALSEQPTGFHFPSLASPEAPDRWPQSLSGISFL